VTPGTQWPELKDHFRDAGVGVVYASISVYRDGTSKGCGIVQLESEDDAQRAIDLLDGSDLDGATIYVREDRKEAGRPVPR